MAPALGSVGTQQHILLLSARAEIQVKGHRLAQFLRRSGLKWTLSTHDAIRSVNISHLEEMEPFDFTQLLTFPQVLLR